MDFKYSLTSAIIGTSITLVQPYTQPASALTAPEVSKIAKQITVRIEYQTGGRKKQGSGFIIGLWTKANNLCDRSRSADIFLLLTLKCI